MTERFKKAYDSLTKAYFEGTLAKGTCTACACGNIIFDAVGDPVTKEDLQDEIHWRHIGKDSTRPVKMIHAESIWGFKRFANLEPGGPLFKALNYYKDEVNKAGYTTEEFAKIETAFERNTRINLGAMWLYDEQQILEDQYKGLCAVVDVLLELDEDASPAEPLKEELRKHPKLQTV